MESVEKVIVDTDCGIDDALALLLAFSNKRNHQVVAITCCHGNTTLDNVCRNVKRVLNVCGQRDVPIYRGCSGALISGKRTESWKSFHGADGFGNCSPQFPTGNLDESDVPAAVALVELTLKYPGQISLVAIGPLTNVALAHRLDSMFTHRLKSMSIMGGNCRGIGNETTVAEFNFYADPEAADIVLGESKCPIILIPWETTRTFGIQWIPVYRGCDGPLIHHKTQDYTSDGSCHAADGLGNRGHEFSTGDIVESDIPAAVALVQLTLKHSGEITLVAIGPLTNVALAQRLDPQFTGRLKSLVVMGGNYKGVGNVTEVAEFNFYSDPEAADIVLGETVCPITLVPWEATIEFAIDWDMYERLVEVKTPKGEFIKCVSKFMADRGRKKGNKKYYDCDLLAVAALLYPQCVTSSLERSVAVECRGTHSRGLTVLLYPVNPLASKRNKVKITTGFDQKFLDQLRFRMLEH